MIVLNSKCINLKLRRKEPDVWREPSRTAKEIAKILGLKNVGSVWSSVYRGTFPKPDFVVGNCTIVDSKFRYTKAYWRLSTIIKEQKRIIKSLTKG